MDTLAASSPIDDAERLKALRLLNIDDKRLDESLGDVVRRVGELFETTVCFINLVFQDRQVFRSWFGGVPDELMRAGNTHERSLCTYVVEERAPLIIQDLLDSATWREPFDWSELIMNFYSPIGVRFYAGLPLITSGGHALGTLCLIDMRPRQMDAAALESLQFFAAKAAAELELATQSETTRRLREELERTSKYASALSDLVARLQQATEVRNALDAALSVIRDAAWLGHVALVAIDPVRVIGSAGAIPPDFPDGILRQHLDATEARYLEGVAIVPLPTSMEGSLVLVGGRSRDAPWTEADRFFLQSSSQLLATSVQRFSRAALPDQTDVTDDVTGVGNRQAFDRLAGQPIDPSEHWLVFAARLSGLTLLRETQGEPVADFVLRRMAEALTRSVRPEDRGRLFRTADDGFAIVVGAAASDASAISARFEKAVGEALRSYDGLRLRLDLGVAAIPDEVPAISEAVALLDSRRQEPKPPDATGLLSDRERQIMMMIVNGRRTKEIALELDISETTVATHRARLLKKMGLRDNRDLFRYALHHGLAE